MRLSPLIILVFVLMVCTVAGLGCLDRKSSPQPVSTTDATAGKEEKPSWVDPFLDAGKGKISAASVAKLGELHISGLALLALCTALRFLAGKWKPAVITFGLGILAAACAVLLTDYPRVVLIIPICGLAVLIGYAVKLILEWWTGYRAFVAVSGEIEAADTGKVSLGQLVKNRFKEAGLTSVIDKALKKVEKLWPTSENK